MLQEPAFAFPMTDGKSYVCLEDGQYHAYLDREAAVLLLHSLHWFYDQQAGEEISIRSGLWGELPRRGKQIGYCEIHLVPSHVQKKQGKNIRKEAQPTLRHKPHGEYCSETDRLDYFVSPEEVKAAYEILTKRLEDSEGSKTVYEVALFDTLLLHIMP